ncbi:hypothetical protein [Streptomyces palmae]|uniref:Uncharacterized protein n=1 Tax=Streptomyces palmae TaxID=1701085 RepID=A0A4Z0GVH4_9ACTN|nr:hypothetical protein [Streptomyces palmae]TGB00645.1 hypothetical protein E4099_21655 [Streptomyces palmae]
MVQETVHIPAATPDNTPIPAPQCPAGSVPVSVGGDVAGQALFSPVHETGTRLNPDGTGYVRFVTATMETDVVVYTVCAELTT